MSSSKLNDFLDRYIEGEKNSYFFCILDGEDNYMIQGGNFFRKQDARDCLLAKLVEFLDNPPICYRSAIPKSIKK